MRIAPLEQLLRQHGTADGRRRRAERHEQGPSPVFLNSVPPDAAIASRNRPKYSSRSSSARTGPTDVANLVEPTKSTSQIVASSTDSATRPLARKSLPRRVYAADRPPICVGPCKRRGRDSNPRSA